MRVEQTSLASYQDIGVASCLEDAEDQAEKSSLTTRGSDLVIGASSTS